MVTFAARIRSMHSTTALLKSWRHRKRATHGTDWFQGTADAVRKNLPYIEQYGIDYVLILSGDQLYRMDFEKLIETHIEPRRMSRSPVVRSIARRRRPLESCDSMTPVASPGFWKSRRPREIRNGAHGSGMDRCPGSSEPGSRLYGQPGYLRLQSRNAGRSVEQNELP